MEWFAVTVVKSGFNLTLSSAAAKVRFPLSCRYNYNFVVRSDLRPDQQRYEKIRYESPDCIDVVLTAISDSVSRSPLYSLYSETISGVATLRSFGASSKFLRDMLQCVDTVGFL